MPTIPALATKRTRAQTRMRDSCNIYSVATIATPQGPRKVETIRTGQPTACRFAVLAGRELERAMQIAADADVVVTLPANTTMAGTDRITVTQAETGAVFRVEVQHINLRSEEIERRVLAKNMAPA